MNDNADDLPGRYEFSILFRTLLGSDQVHAWCWIGLQFRSSGVNCTPNIQDPA